ncbi:hypothetical protein [Neisseria sp.]
MMDGPSERQILYLLSEDSEMDKRVAENGVPSGLQGRFSANPKRWLGGYPSISAPYPDTVFVQKNRQKIIMKIMMLK